jgi:FdhD protein
VGQTRNLGARGWECDTDRVKTDRRPGPTQRVRVREWQGDTVTVREDRLATEEPLEIRLAWPDSPPQGFVTTMRTPGHDFALAAGLAYAEGVFDDIDRLRTVAYCTDVDLLPEQKYNVVTIDLAGPPVRWTERTIAMTSACGVCGKQSIDAVFDTGATPQPIEPTIDARIARGLPDTLREAQRIFDSTGGLHAAGLFRADGTPLVVREDIGRHNAVDKVVGQQLLDRIPTRPAALAVSGRLGFEIVQKAAAARIPVVVAVGAASSLAVQVAESFGVCLASFVRGDRMVVHSHHERLT